MGGITVTQRIRIAKIAPFQYKRWPLQQPSWNSSFDISSQTISQSRNLIGGIGALQRFRIAKIILFRYSRWLPWWPSCNYSNDLPNLQSDWAKTWWEVLEQQRDSELLKLFCSIIQDGRRVQQPSWNSSNDISFHTISWIEPKLDEIWNCLNLSLWLSKMVAQAAILKILKPYLLLNP